MEWAPEIGGWNVAVLFLGLALLALLTAGLLDSRDPLKTTPTFWIFPACCPAAANGDCDLGVVPTWFCR